jgi:hypothetical protein
VHCSLTTWKLRTTTLSSSDGNGTAAAAAYDSRDQPRLTKISLQSAVMSRRNLNEMHGGSEESFNNLQYSWRNTRQFTPYKHRRTSSLTPAQIMDQQTYYGYAWTSLAQGMHIFHLVLLHLASYLRLRWFLDWMGDSTGYYFTSIWTKMESIKVCVDKVLFLMHWILAHGEIALLQAEDLSIYV